MADMWGIDVSHWTKDPYGTDYEKSDFVITKLTNGASEYQYENFGHECIKKTLSDGKLAGAYHYACGGAPEDEARVLQALLAGHGFYDGAFDGIVGVGTCEAMQACERVYGLGVDSSDYRLIKNK